MAKPTDGDKRPADDGTSSGKDLAANREAFRAAVSNALERRMFFIPAFKIYGGVAGLYDYGPPGCSIKANVLQFWRQHYVMEENMLEVECTCVTPEVVLKASGHVEKFTDLMVKDVKTAACYRADHLLKDFIELELERNAALAPAKREEYREVLARVDELTAEELGGKLRSYGIKAPDTKNELSDPYPFNLMFATSIGPTGLLQGYLRPETAQGIFVNFRDLLYYNGNKLPFAAAQIGQAFRNEIAPRAGLLRVREFTLAEIEHFVNPDDKSHPKFRSVAGLEFLLFPRAEQLGAEKKAVKYLIGEAVGKGIVNNETLGYFIARTYIFLTKLGIDPQRLRFRQHLQHEMAHYAQDCWDAEIECSYGWIECVGLADRSAFDLTQHTAKSKIELVAYEKYEKPREVEVVTVVPDKKELGKALKKEAKIVTEALQALSDDEAMALKDRLDKDGTAPLTICTTGQEFTVTPAWVAIKREKKTVSGRSYVPSVIEPSFGIGRIIYCMYEHSFYVRGADEQRTVFRFTPLVAPIKATVFPLVSNPELDAVARVISSALTAAALPNKVDTTGTSIGKRYARTDELGVPYAVTVDFETLEQKTVTLRERDTTAQVRIPSSEVSALVRQLADGTLTWPEVQERYPATAAGKEEKDDK